MEQTDTLLNGYKIIQDPERFMFGIDAVLLSYFAAEQVRKGDKVIDLCTGTGIIPLLMESVCGAKEFAAVEVQKESADMAKRSVEMNGLDGRIKIFEGDIKKVKDLFSCHSFDVVTCNPPYMICDHGKKNLTDAKSIARHEVLCTLSDVIAAADYLLKPQGKLFIIHKAFRLPEIFADMAERKLEAKRMRLVSPCVGKEPNLVLIEARKNAKPRLKIEADLPVYESCGEGVYSEEVRKIYESFVREA